MARPIADQAFAGATSTGTSEPIRSKGHYHATIFVRANNIDSASDTLSVSLEFSPNGSVWDEMEDSQGNDMTFSASDFSISDVVSAQARGVAMEEVRANIDSLTDNANGDLTVDVWIVLSGNAGTGYRAVASGGT